MTADETPYFSLPTFFVFSILQLCEKGTSTWYSACGMATVVLYDKFLKDLRATLYLNEKYAKHFICAFAQMENFHFQKAYISMFAIKKYNLFLLWSFLFFAKNDNRKSAMLNIYSSICNSLALQ